MDRDAGSCGAADAVHPVAWPDGWQDRQAPERRPARVGSPCLRVDAIVHRRSVQVTSVRGWRQPVADPGGARAWVALDRLVSGPSPCEACEQSEEAARIRAALATLPGRYRHALHLVFVEGRTHGETASHLAVPLGTAKAWVIRGLRALRIAHASLGNTPTPAVAAASRLLIGLRLESCRVSRVTREVTATPG